MMEHEEQNPNNQIAIPKIFRSDLTGLPMDKCISCEKNLLVEGTQYIIEKAIKPYGDLSAYSTIFEYAMCLPCAESMRSKISKGSMKNINEYFAKNLNPGARSHLHIEEASESIDPWLNHCLVKGLDVSEMGECQIYAQCNGDKLVVREFPYMISGVVLDEVMQLLSAETLEEFDDLKNQLLDSPSEFQDLLQGGPRVFI